MRKKYLLILSMCAILTGIFPLGKIWAFDYGLKIFEKSAIQALSDEALKQAYVDVLIEVEAAKVFHVKAGFTPRDYQQFKDLIRYRTNLFFELQRRKLEIPKIQP